MSNARNIANLFSTLNGRGAYTQVQGNGITLTSRSILNIVNGTVVDDSANNRTTVTIGGVVQDILDGGAVDSTANYDGGTPTSSSYTYNLIGGTP
jgi:hypothetical protein